MDRREPFPEPGFSHPGTNLSGDEAGYFSQQANLVYCFVEMDFHENRNQDDERRGEARSSAVPEIGKTTEGPGREGRARRSDSGRGFKVTVVLASLIICAVMSACELLNSLFFPELTFWSMHVGAIVPGAVTAVAAVYFVVRKYRSLIEKSQREIAGRERVEAALRESEELYRTVVENVADGIAITAGTERVMVNRAFLAIHGLEEASRVISQPFDQFILPEDRDAVNERVRARQRGENLDKIGEYRIVRPDGETRTLQVSVEVLRYKGSPATLAVLRDVTEIKAAEAKIRSLNRDLEQHVKDLEVANNDLNAFNTMVSHDLHTPLAAIQGFARRIAERGGQVTEEKRAEWLARIRAGADRMEHLIEDLLAYSRLGREAARFGVVSVRQVVASLIEDLVCLYPGGRVTVHDLPDAFGDEGMLRQAFSNLLSNAFKYTARVPDRVIEVRGLVEGGDTIYSVADNGIGFDMKDKERIFEIFRRLHGSDEFEGTGVGLAIVRRTAAFHGGRAWAEGGPGEGATFYLSLPAGPGGLP